MRITLSECDCGDNALWGITLCSKTSLLLLQPSLILRALPSIYSLFIFPFQQLLLHHLPVPDISVCYPPSLSLPPFPPPKIQKKKFGPPPPCRYKIRNLLLTGLNGEFDCCFKSLCYFKILQSRWVFSLVFKKFHTKMTTFAGYGR